MLRSVALPLFIGVASSAVACMSIGPAPVRFNGQTNLIVWDAAHGTEHFVRDAKFETNGQSLGFIAPTPGRPEIVAVDGAVFDELRRLGPLGRGFGYPMSAGGLGGGGGVTVIERKIVAGYEATVLRADDAGQLAAWLRVNNYPTPRYATQWMSRYVRGGWYFTAFKVSTQEGAGATGPVRMSFKTSRPFNPYSVPAENRGRGGLELYYVSPTAEEGKIGGARPWLDSRWSDLVSDAVAQKMEIDLKLPKGSIPNRSFVNYYRDANFGQPGLDDIYFVEKPKRIAPRGFGSFAGMAALGFCALIRPSRRRAKLRRWDSI